ncbi:MAG TPA: aldehyde dehydrogenase family protein [Bacteroidales bacterium]|nr:aldehyde dehydrogenase family protein [Bacteroidales bacterium]
MEKEKLELILDEQRKFFESGRTLDIEFRLENLKKLRSLILSHEDDLIEALYKDFHKPEFEVLGTETRFVISELNILIRNLRKWARRKRVKTSVANFMARSYVVPQPYGQVLILSPWNYPFHLSMIPAMSAIAAGNCVILKVSQKVTNTVEVISKILDNFPGKLITLIKGEHSLTDYLLNYSFDYIFFTGSMKVGKKVMASAAANLCPVTLELGGKNPCVVTADAKLDYAAKRIASGKFINAGQTCIAPDYLLIDSRVKDRFIELMINEIKLFYGDDPAKSEDYCRMINKEKAARMKTLIENVSILSGGQTDPENCYVEPTIVTDVSPDHVLMQEEIFGPVLPVITFNDFNEIFAVIGRNPRPLAAYIFTASRNLATEFQARTQSGSIVVNDTVMQVASPDLPFGGVGPSGSGRYHGKKSFETFSNMRSVMVKSNLIDIPVRYPPYTKIKKKALKLLLR